MRVKLKELGEVITGNTPSKMILDYWDSDDISFVKPDIISDSGITTIVESSEYLSEKAREKARIVSENAIFVTCIGSIGKIGIAGPGYYAFNQQINVIVPNENVVPKYLAYAMLHSKPQLTAIANAPVVPIINKSQFSDFEINIDTDMQKQVEIVNVLDKVVGIIQARENELLKLDNLVKARFVELFGLPVSNTKGWKTEQMNDVAPSVSYLGDFDDEVWLLNLDMVEAQTGRILDYLIVSKDEVGNSTCTFDTSNVLYSKLRPYLNKVVMPDRCGYATSELVPLQPVKSKINREYLAFMLRSDEFVNMINEKVAGAKMPRVSMGDFRKFDVPVPPMELQKQFGDFVHRVDKSKDAVQKSLDKLQILFDKLMQEYFG
ncbi:MAG: restriction endonuclease subunit S [Firmicutes bacterium]|nr:restriction endonuclease subunit S [Bacillota bacterium]